MASWRWGHLSRDVQMKISQAEEKWCVGAGTEGGEG